MRLPAEVRAVAEAALAAPVRGARAAGGGSINEAAVVETDAGAAFAKWHLRAPAGFFEAEADGLSRLAATETVATPEVLACERRGDVAVLLLAYHAPGRSGDGAQAEAGRALALLHRRRGHAPGLERDNYMGAVPQRNGPASDERWLTFFRERRLLALSDGLPARTRRALERLELGALLTEPEGGCALLHGDLWGGNLLTTAAGRAVFIDPAVYHGHPEVDLAMTRLFGGFTGRFYDAYQEVAGRFDRGLYERLEVLNLYPLLIHVRLFGGGYLGQVEATLARYGG